MHDAAHSRSCFHLRIGHGNCLCGLALNSRDDPRCLGNHLVWLDYTRQSDEGGLSTYAFRTSTAAAANAASVKAVAGNLYGYSFYNAAAAVRYVYLYNFATAPTMGTTTDIIVTPIPAGGAVGMNFADIGVGFGTGIAIAVTTAPAANDNTVSGITVGDVTGVVYYA